MLRRSHNGSGEQSQPIAKQVSFFFIRNNSKAGVVCVQVLVAFASFLVNMCGLVHVLFLYHSVGGRVVYGV